LSAAAGAGPGALLVAAVQPSDVGWAVLIAGLVWALGWLVIATVGRGRPPRTVGFPQPVPAPDIMPDPALPGSLTRPAAPPVPEEDHVAGVLHWLVAETEAECVAYLHLAPGGRERIVVEPRGLEASTVAELARAGRQALLGPRVEPPAGTVVTRWLGAGGSKVLLLRGVVPTMSQEPLRFARFAIEWSGASLPAAATKAVEERVRSVPGVAWAELNGRDAAEIRVMVSDSVQRELVEEAVERLLRETGTRARWVEPASRETPPRARLLEVAVNANGEADAEVSLEWRGQELRGRGHASASPAGRHRAAADAVADALGPLLAGEATIEGLYTHAHEDHDLLVVVVHIEGERLVGAVQNRQSEPDASAARAVLDAVNRRLSMIAGGSGRI
jgi:hypothetical protein